jgi:signal peptidase I
MHTIQRLLLGGLQLGLWVVLIGFVALLVLPRVSAYDVLIVRGGSMEPTIHVGSVVIVDRNSRSPRVGTATSFRDPGGALITHRVIGIDEGGYETRGDANPAADMGRRSLDQVHGTVVTSIPFLGYVLHLLHQPIVFLFLLLGTGGMLVVGEVQAIWKELRESRRQPAHDAARDR